MAATSPVLAPAERVTAASANDITGLKRVLRTAMTDSRFFLAGTVGGMAGVAAGQPFDTVKVRLQTHGMRLTRYWVPEAPLGMRECISNMFWEEGVRGFYRGMSSPMLGVGLQKSTAFGVYGFAKTKLQGNRAEPLLHHVTLAGMAGGIANSTILTPVDQLKICLQVEAPAAATAAAENPTTLRAAARNIIAGHIVESSGSRWSASVRGIAGIYAALPATLMREIPGYSLYFTTYELLSRLRRKYDATWAIPFTGGFAGVIMWATYYPLDMVKSRAMAEVANAAIAPSRRGMAKTSSLQSIFRQLYREGGVRGFYTGVQPALIRAFFTHAVVFVMYETVLHLAAGDVE